MVSIKDIANAVGVTPSTVSVVLNGKAKEKRISEELAYKIIEASKKLGYFPNRSAVSLRTGKSKAVGLIVEDISNYFFSSLAKIIEDEIRMSGYNVVYCSSENDPLKGGELIQMLYNQQVDGYLITPSYGMESYIEKLVQRKKPVVLMDRGFEHINLPCVMVNNFEGMKNGISLLLKAGYKSIGYVTNDLDQMQMKEREHAYNEALKTSGLATGKTNILRLKYSYPKKQAIKKISEFITGNVKFDAMVFATNYLGIYGLQCIKELGLIIKKDIGVLCFDDHDIFSLHTPPITVIEQPTKEIAVTAVKILMSELHVSKPFDYQKVRLNTKIILRESI